MQNDVLKNILRQVLDQLKKKYSFNKQQNTLYRYRDGVYQIIDFQRIRCLSGPAVTMNIGFGLVKVSEVDCDSGWKSRQMKDRFHVRLRIGRLMELLEDKLYFIESKKVQDVADEIIEDIVQHVIPFFEQLQTENQILQFIRTKGCGYSEDKELELIKALS